MRILSFKDMIQMSSTMTIPVTPVGSNQDFIGTFHPYCTKCHISEHSNLFHQI
jgi:hypothetical protein